MNDFTSKYDPNMRFFIISILLSLYFYLFLSIDKLNTLIYVFIAIFFIKIYSINSNQYANNKLKIEGDIYGK